LCEGGSRDAKHRGDQDSGQSFHTSLLCVVMAQIDRTIAFSAVLARDG
jgi:hypothetical protein